MAIVPNTKPDLLYQGITLQWTPDTAKDPAGKARLALLIR
jgi:hypothetical protein